MASKQMSLAEAFEALGLQVPASGDADGAFPDALTLRKAYVRAIKRYSPESYAQKRLPAPTADYILLRAHKIARIHCPGDVAPVQAPNEGAR